MAEKQANENPSERRGSEQLQQAERGRQGSEAREDPAHTPSKAEGDEATVDEALRNQK
jgi:hypothetical protein